MKMSVLRCATRRNTKILEHSHKDFLRSLKLMRGTRLILEAKQLSSKLPSLSTERLLCKKIALWASP